MYLYDELQQIIKFNFQLKCLNPSNMNSFVNQIARRKVLLYSQFCKKWNKKVLLILLIHLKLNMIKFTETMKTMFEIAMHRVCDIGNEWNKNNSPRSTPVGARKKQNSNNFDSAYFICMQFKKCYSLCKFFFHISFKFNGKCFNTHYIIIVFATIWTNRKRKDNMYIMNEHHINDNAQQSTRVFIVA